MRKVDAPVFQILLRHHDEGRVSNRTGRANDAFADGTEHSGFRNVQQTAQLACADERQIVTGFLDFDSHNAEVGVSTQTNLTIPRRILPPGLVELPGDPMVSIPVLGEGDVFDERLPALREDVLQRAFPNWRGGLWECGLDDFLAGALFRPGHYILGDAKFLDGLREFGVSLHCFAAHTGLGGDAFGCCWSLPILSFYLGVLICSRLIRDGQFSRIVEFPPHQRRCVWGQGSLPKLGTEFFVNGDGVAGAWKYGHDADDDMSTSSIRA